MCVYVCVYIYTSQLKIAEQRRAPTQYTISLAFDFFPCYFFSAAGVIPGGR